MAFGMRVNGGGDYMDIVKYDAKAGRMFRVDKDPARNYERNDVDITNSPKFAIDFGALEVGYIKFTMTGPDTVLAPWLSPTPQQPQEKDDNGKPTYKPGFRVRLAGSILGEGLREFSSTAGCVVNAMDALWNEFAACREAQAGQIPVIEMVSTTPITSGQGAKKSTAYAPVFKIIAWTDRTEAMGARTVPAPGSSVHAAIGPQAAPQRASNHVGPPAAPEQAPAAHIAAQAAQPATTGMPSW